MRLGTVEAWDVEGEGGGLAGVEGSQGVRQLTEPVESGPGS